MAITLGRYIRQIGTTVGPLAAIRKVGVRRQTVANSCQRSPQASIGPSPCRGEGFRPDDDERQLDVDGIMEINEAP